MKMVSLSGVAGDDVSNEAYPASFNTGGSLAYCGNFTQIYLRCISQALNIYVVITGKRTGADNIYRQPPYMNAA
jgi:hypothetical protein